ncbi:hypothetical protein GCM10025864_41950 [Luteimicrobium album]|uniref:Uncharacterized protein n=1 Tax=Luteimicrobium album TaxID=1054550 RepID=A0ABQ6I6W7_9MICO|nr:hypothetical protein GCM10025864_41950 [Luteimicrobium album]
MRGLGEVQAHESVAAAGPRQGSVPAPQDLARRRQLVEQRGGVVPDPGGQHERLERRRRHGSARELLDGAQQTGDPAQGPRASGRPCARGAGASGHALPGREEQPERPSGHRLDLGPQCGERAPPERPQHVGVAELVADPAERRGPQPAAHEGAGRREPAQHLDDDRAREAVARRDVARGERTVRARVAPHQVAERVGHGLEEHLGQPDRERDAQRVPQPGGVLDDGPLVLLVVRRPRDADAHDPARGLEPGQPGRGLRAPVGHGAGGERRRRERPEPAQHVPQALGVSRLATGRERLQLGLGPLDLLRVQQVRELAGAVAAEQLGQQRRVERERGRAPLRERGVAVVQELRGVAEEEGLGERRRRRGRHLDDAHPAALDRAHEVGERRGVEVVLEALARGLEDDRELGVAGRDRQELRRALALLPQRLPLVGPAARQQERAGCGLAEARREQHRAAERVADLLDDLVGLQ